MQPTLKPGTHWRRLKSTVSDVSATKSTELATMSTARSGRIQVVADLSPKTATKSTVLAIKLTVSAAVDFVADMVDYVASVCVRGQSNTVDFVDFQQSRPWSQSRPC